MQCRCYMEWKIHARVICESAGYLPFYLPILPTTPARSQITRSEAKWRFIFGLLFHRSSYIQNCGLRWECRRGCHPVCGSTLRKIPRTHEQWAFLQLKCYKVQATRCQVSTNGIHTSGNHRITTNRTTQISLMLSKKISICAELSATSLQRVGQWRYSSHSWQWWLAAARSGRLTLKKHPRYSIDKRLGGTHNRSGNWRRENSLPLTWVDHDPPRLCASSCRLHQGRNFRETICPRASWCLQRDFRCSQIC